MQPSPQTRKQNEKTDPSVLSSPGGGVPSIKKRKRGKWFDTAPTGRNRKRQKTCRTTKEQDASNAVLRDRVDIGLFASPNAAHSLDVEISSVGSVDSTTIENPPLLIEPMVIENLNQANFPHKKILEVTSALEVTHQECMSISSGSVLTPLNVEMDKVESTLGGASSNSPPSDNKLLRSEETVHETVLNERVEPSLEQQSIHQCTCKKGNSSQLSSSSKPQVSKMDDDQVTPKDTKLSNTSLSKNDHKQWQRKDDQTIDDIHMEEGNTNESLPADSAMEVEAQENVKEYTHLRQHQPIWLGGRPLAVWRPIKSDRPWKNDNRRLLTLMEIYAECKNQVEIIQGEGHDVSVQVKPLYLGARYIGEKDNKHHLKTMVDKPKQIVTRTETVTQCSNVQKEALPNQPKLKSSQCILM